MKIETQFEIGDRVLISPDCPAVTQRDKEGWLPPSIYMVDSVNVAVDNADYCNPPVVNISYSLIPVSSWCEFARVSVEQRFLCYATMDAIRPLLNQKRARIDEILANQSAKPGHGM